MDIQLSQRELILGKVPRTSGLCVLAQHCCAGRNGCLQRLPSLRWRSAQGLSQLGASAQLKHRKHGYPEVKPGARVLCELQEAHLGPSPNYNTNPNCLFLTVSPILGQLGGFPAYPRKSHYMGSKSHIPWAHVYHCQSWYPHKYWKQDGSLPSLLIPEGDGKTYGICAVTHLWGVRQGKEHLRLSHWPWGGAQRGRRDRGLKATSGQSTSEWSPCI